MGRRAGPPKVWLPPGKHVYLCRFTANGRRLTVSTRERDHGRAVEAADRLQAEARLGRPVNRPRRVSHADSASIAALSAEYLAQLEGTGRAASYLNKQAMHFRAHFLPRWERLSDLTAAAIERYTSERAQERTNRGGTVQPPTVYKELVTLSRFLRWCKKHVADYDPPMFDRVKPVSAYESPDFTEQDVRALLAELPDRTTHPKRHAVREFFTVQWAQGMRPGEVAKMRWGDVDLERRRITIRQKHDKAREKHDRVIAMAAEAHAVLVSLAAAARHLPTTLVFGWHDHRGSLAAARERARLGHVTPHHLRHARLTELAGKTQDVAALQYLAGHRNLSTTDRYVRSRAQRTEDLLRAASDSEIRRPPGPEKRKGRAAGKK